MNFIVKLCILFSFVWTDTLATSVTFVDSGSNSYLRPGHDVSLDISTFRTVVTLVNGLEFGTDSPSSRSSMISDLLQPSPFKKPSAYVVINHAGFDISNKMTEENDQRTVRRVEVDVQSTRDVLDAFVQIKQSNMGVNFVTVRGDMVQDCDSQCLEGLFSEVVQNLGAHYTATDTPFHGMVEFSNGHDIDLSQKANRLFVLELAAIYSQVLREIEGNQSGPQDIKIFEISIASGVEIQHLHGKASQEYGAANKLAQNLMKLMLRLFDNAFHGNVVYEIVSFDESVDLKQETEFSAASSRHLLQTDNSSIVADAQMFSTKAAGYGAFILLLYFSLAAIWCMCFMPLKHDTLLYGKSKGD